MTILEDIQNSAVDSKSDLATLLRKCKVLAARLGSQPLEAWLVWEANGYPEDVAVPEYRIWALEVFGHFWGPFGSRYENVPIPVPVLAFLSEDTKQAYIYYRCRYSIASVEAMLSKAGTENLTVSTGSLAVVIGRKFVADHDCVKCWAEFGTTNLVELLNSVRNRILDFALAISKEAPTAGETSNTNSQNVDSSRVTQIFYTTVYGGAANLVGTATASAIAFNIGPSIEICCQAELAP